MGRVLDGLLLALCAVLVALSYYGFTLYCESFGCMGRGLVWMLWAVLAAASAAVALGVRAWQRHCGLPTRASGAALALLLALGAGLDRLDLVDLDRCGADLAAALPGVPALYAVIEAQAPGSESGSVAGPAG